MDDKLVDSYVDQHSVMYITVQSLLHIFLSKSLKYLCIVTHTQV